MRRPIISNSPNSVRSPIGHPQVTVRSPWTLLRNPQTLLEDAKNMSCREGHEYLDGNWAIKNNLTLFSAVSGQY
ncbi:MAG: hypothetical protein ACI97A_001522 [Planctomycetota bacterium]|jgi:hypothetical protein